MKKILVIRFSSIGDLVLTSPVFRCLKTQLPDVQIHLLTKRSYLSVMEGNPYIDKIITIHQRVGEVSHELRKEKYDEIIDLHNNTRSLFVKLLLFTLPSFTLNKLNIKKFLLVHCKINRLPNIHIVDRYLDTISHLGVKNDGKGLDHFIPEHEHVNMKELPETFHHGFIAIALGSKHYTKQIPLNKLIELCQLIPKPIVLLGGHVDREKAASIITMLPNQPIFNACGIYNINQSASLVQQSNILITPDTGLMHIASALNKPIISVWGNTVKEFGMYALMPKENGATTIMIENTHLACRPCSKLGYKKCPKGHFKCMNDIDMAVVAEYINKGIS